MVTWLGAAAGAIVVTWLVAGLVTEMARPETDNTSPSSPLASRRDDQAFGLAVGLMVGPVVGLGVGLANGQLARGFADGIGGGLVAWLLTGLVYPQSWSSSLAFAQLAASDRTPIRLMRFLEDARSRGILRTVGPVYQFRHARLQDRVAVQELGNGHKPASLADQLESHEKRRPPALTSTDVNGQDDAEHLFCPSLRSAIEAVPRAPNEP